MASSEGREWLSTSRHSLFAIRPLGRFSSQLLALLDGFFDGADHIEGGFRQVIVLAFADRAEALDGVGEIDELAGRTGEDCSDVERLRQGARVVEGGGDGGVV